MNGHLLSASDDQTLCLWDINGTVEANQVSIDVLILFKEDITYERKRFGTYL